MSLCCFVISIQLVCILQGWWLWNGWVYSDVLKIQLLTWNWFLLVWTLQHCVLLEITAALTRQSSGCFVPFSCLNLTSPMKSKSNLKHSNCTCVRGEWTHLDRLPGWLHCERRLSTMKEHASPTWLHQWVVWVLAKARRLEGSMWLCLGALWLDHLQGEWIGTISHIHPLQFRACLEKGGGRCCLYHKWLLHDKWCISRVFLPRVRKLWLEWWEQQKRWLQDQWVQRAELGCLFWGWVNQLSHVGSPRHGDEQDHTEGEDHVVKRTLMIAQKSFWQCDLLGCDGVFHIKWQMPHHTWYLRQDEHSFTVGDHSLSVREALGRLARVGSTGSVTTSCSQLERECLKSDFYEVPNWLIIPAPPPSTHTHLLCPETWAKRGWREMLSENSWGRRGPRRVKEWIHAGFF